MIEQPEGIIITVSRSMIRDSAARNYRMWLRQFFYCMSCDDCHYWFRLGNQPKLDVLYIYLCIGNKIRYRVTYAGCKGPGHPTFSDGRSLAGKAWVFAVGPVVAAPYIIRRKGFQGFRYTGKLF